MKKDDVTVVSMCEFRPKRADCFFVSFLLRCSGGGFCGFQVQLFIFYVDKKAPSSPSSDQIKEVFLNFLSHAAPSTVQQAVRQVVHAPPAQKSSADGRMKVKALGYIDRPPAGCHGDANKSSAPPPTSARLV